MSRDYQRRQLLSPDHQIPTQPSQQPLRDLNSTFADGVQWIRTSSSLDKILAILAVIQAVMATLRWRAVPVHSVGPGPILCRPGTSGAAHSLQSLLVLLLVVRTPSPSIAPIRCNVSLQATGATATQARLERLSVTLYIGQNFHFSSFCHCSQDLVDRTIHYARPQERSKPTVRIWICSNVATKQEDL